MQALIAVVLPMLVNALSSVLGKSVAEFNALPRSERPAKLRAVLRSKWMLTSPPAAIAARALAATDAGVNAAVNALEKYGSGAVALGTEAAHAAAEKHLAKNPRSGGRMARVRIAPSIPTYALDRLDVTRARRNGHATPDTLTTLNVGDRIVLRDESSPDRDSLPYTVTYRKFDDVKLEHATGASAALFADGGTVAIRGGGRTRTVYSIRRVNGARRNGYSRRRNCGGDCACAPCQAAARSNPDPFAAVRRATEKKVLRYVEEGTWGQLVDAAYRVYEKHRIATGEQLPIEAVVAEINAARTRAEGLRSAHNKRATHAAEQAYRDEMRGRSSYMNPATRRNHHIRVGGTFYTPGGRRGTVLEEARGGYYRVRWSDGTVGTVQDNEWAAYPTAGSRANGARKNGKSDYYAIVVDMAGNEHMVGPMSLLAAKDRIRALEAKGLPDGMGGIRPLKRGAGHVRSAQAVMSSALLKYRNNGRRTFRVRFHSAVGQGSRLKQIVERWGGKVGGGGVATFAAADDAENAMLQAEKWGIAGEAVK